MPEIGELQNFEPSEYKQVAKLLQLVKTEPKDHENSYITSADKYTDVLNWVYDRMPCKSTSDVDHNTADKILRFISIINVAEDAQKERSFFRDTVHSLNAALDRNQIKKNGLIHNPIKEPIVLKDTYLSNVQSGKDGFPIVRTQYKETIVRSFVMLEKLLEERPDFYTNHIHNKADLAMGYLGMMEELGIIGDPRFARIEYRFAQTVLSNAQAGSQDFFKLYSHPIAQDTMFWDDMKQKREGLEFPLVSDYLHTFDQQKHRLIQARSQYRQGRKDKRQAPRELMKPGEQIAAAKKYTDALDQMRKNDPDMVERNCVQEMKRASERFEKEFQSQLQDKLSITSEGEKNSVANAVSTLITYFAIHDKGFVEGVAKGKDFDPEQIFTSNTKLYDRFQKLYEERDPMLLWLHLFHESQTGISNSTNVSDSRFVKSIINDPKSIELASKICIQHLMPDVSFPLSFYELQFNGTDFGDFVPQMNFLYAGNQTNVKISEAKRNITNYLSPLSEVMMIDFPEDAYQDVVTTLDITSQTTESKKTVQEKIITAMKSRYGREVGKTLIGLGLLAGGGKYAIDFENAWNRWYMENHPDMYNSPAHSIKDSFSPPDTLSTSDIENIQSIKIGEIFHLPKEITNNPDDGIGFFSVGEYGEQPERIIHPVSPDKLQIIQSVTPELVQADNEQQFVYSLPYTGTVLHLFEGHTLDRLMLVGGNTDVKVSEDGAILFGNENKPETIIVFSHQLPKQTMIDGRVVQFSGISFQPYTWNGMDIPQRSAIEGNLIQDQKIATAYSTFNQELKQSSTSDISQTVSDGLHLFEHSIANRKYSLSLEDNNPEQNRTALESIGNNPDSAFYCSIASAATAQFISQGTGIRGYQTNGFTVYAQDGHMTIDISHRKNLFVLPSGEGLYVDFTPSEPLHPEQKELLHHRVYVDTGIDMQRAAERIAIFGGSIGGIAVADRLRRRKSKTPAPKAKKNNSERPITEIIKKPVKHSSLESVPSTDKHISFDERVARIDQELESISIHPLQQECLELVYKDCYENMRELPSLQSLITVHTIDEIDRFNFSELGGLLKVVTGYADSVPETSLPWQRELTQAISKGNFIRAKTLLSEDLIANAHDIRGLLNEEIETDLSEKSQSEQVGDDLKMVLGLAKKIINSAERFNASWNREVPITKNNINREININRTIRQQIIVQINNGELRESAAVRFFSLLIGRDELYCRDLLVQQTAVYNVNKVK